MQGGCQVYLDSYMASKWIMFHGYLDCFQKSPLKVGLTQNQETMALRTLIIVGLFYFIMHEDPCE